MEKVELVVSKKKKKKNWYPTLLRNLCFSST